MPIDFSACEIHTPKKLRELQRLYEMLAEVFPVEKKLFEDIGGGAYTLYNWEPHTLYQGGEPLGNVSTVMFQVQASGRLRQIAGIASVATPERYRGMGIAGYLMAHVLKIIDARNLPSILFTSLPRVYAGLGYRLVGQTVKQTAVKKLGRTDGIAVHCMSGLTGEALHAAAKLYSAWFPYEGKLLRDEAYWRWYGNAFNNSGNTELAFCRKGGAALGYARLEYEADRILIDEFYAPPEAHEINSALWNRICDAATERNMQTLSLALPPTHWLWNFLRRNGLSFELETGVEREKFMARMPATVTLNLPDVWYWSLSDKF